MLLLLIILFETECSEHRSQSTSAAGKLATVAKDAMERCMASLYSAKVSQL